MENHMHQRSMLPQPLTGSKCVCGCDAFRVLLCPQCKGTPNSHISGHQCVACETIHMFPSTLTAVWEEHENEVH